MKKKSVVITCILIVIVLVVGLFFINNRYLNVSKNQTTSLAVYVYNTTKSDYDASSSLPKGNYVLNTTTSKCVNGGTIGNYNSTNGSISMSIHSSDFCTLYFDLG